MSEENLKYYIVTQDPHYLAQPATFSAHRFYPGKRDFSCDVVDGELGNWWHIIADPRSTEELLIATDIVGMYCREGGNVEATVQGRDLFLSLEEAKKKARCMNKYQKKKTQ